MLVCGPKRSPDYERKTTRDGTKDPLWDLGDVFEVFLRHVQ